MVNFGPLTAEIDWRVWGSLPQQISTGFASSLLCCSDVAYLRPTKPCAMFGRLLGCIFSGALATWLNFARCNMRPCLVFSYIGSVIARHSSSRCQPKLAACYKELNYGTFAEGATCIRRGGHHVGRRPTFQLWVRVKHAYQ